MFDYDAELVRYNARLQAAADIQAEDRVLDIGCGYGATARLMAEELGAEVTGITISEAQHAIACERPLVEAARRGSSGFLQVKEYFYR